jgi:hypothetical protein
MKMMQLAMIVGVIALIGSFAVAYRTTALKPVSWWRTHPQERAQIIGWCREYPGAAKWFANCEAAAEANFQANVDAMLATAPRRR